MMIYSTDFELTAPVIDIDEARRYLDRDDMTRFLKDSVPSEIAEAIENIAWNLVDKRSGTIDLEANRELYDDELEAVSSWIKGQNADGLGESFEQQDFASYLDEDEYRRELDYFERYRDGDDEDEPDMDDYWVVSSFDWKSNDYELERVE